MPSFCITGINHKHLHWVEDLLNSSGVKVAAASAQNDRITFNLWHEKVLGHKQATKATTPGRLWDQLASELFLANIESDNWSWADPRSTLYLDYWLAFDPSVHFILVYCTPQYFLKTAILTSDKKLSFQELMKEWEQYYQLIIQFYTKHSDRCILIDIEDAMQYPNEFIGACNQRFSTELKGKVLEPSTTPEIKSSFEFLINTLLLKQKWVSEFQGKIEPSIQRLSDQRHVQNLPWFAKLRTPFFKNSSHHLTNTLNADLVIEDLRLLCHEGGSSTALSTAIVGSGVIDAKLEADLSSLNEEVKQLKAQKSAVDSEKGQLATQAKTLQEEVKQLKALNTDISQENELLLTQLHLTQEELEKFFFEHKHAEQKLDVAKARWDRLLKREPGYFDFESLYIEPEKANDLQTTKWNFNALTIGPTELDRIELIIRNRANKPLQIVLRNPGASKEGDDAVVDLAWYPSSTTNREEFTLSSNNIKSTDSLSASDFKIIGLLVPFLLTLVDAPAYFNLPKDLDYQSLAVKLRQLNKLLSNSKEELRVDGLTLKNEQTNHDYEHLWFELENISYQEQIIPRFDFRLSCAHVKPTNFGTHPKLEFPPQGDSPILKSWFEESVDDFGPKLELRFALPDSMDIGVFRKVSKTDQDFIKALIQKLPLYLDQLSSRGTRFTRELEDWKKLCLSIQSIIKKVGSQNITTASIDLDEARKKSRSISKAPRKKIATKKSGIHQAPQHKRIVESKKQAQKLLPIVSENDTPLMIDSKDV